MEREQRKELARLERMRLERANPWIIKEEHAFEIPNEEHAFEIPNEETQGIHIQRSLPQCMCPGR
jgi:hypothetical protein